LVETTLRVSCSLNDVGTMQKNQFDVELKIAKTTLSVRRLEQVNSNIRAMMINTGSGTSLTYNIEATSTLYGPKQILLSLSLFFKSYVSSRSLAVQFR
jgi:hypothetical protein